MPDTQKKIEAGLTRAVEYFSPLLILWASHKLSSFFHNMKAKLDKTKAAPIVDEVAAVAADGLTLVIDEENKQ